MYLRHFGLSEYPFGLTPDTGFFFPAGGHQAAVNTLLVALRTGEGFIKLTAEIGLGKTTICRKLLAEIGPRFETAYIPNPQLTPTGLYRALARELGMTLAPTLGRDILFARLTDVLLEIASRGRRVVLLIDEAQALSDDTLEAVRLLTNLETEKFKLLQVVLVGQPELDRRLSGPALRQLRQRIAFSHRLVPLSREQVDRYVAHRCRVAGHPGGGIFEPAALALLTRTTAGVPRLVNLLCHKAMMAAYGKGSRTVGRRHMRAAIADSHEAVTARPLVSAVLARRARVAFVGAALGASATMALLLSGAGG